MEQETAGRQERFSLAWHGWVWGVLFLLVGAIPLCMYMRVVPIPPEILESWTGQPQSFDFFTFYRSRWIILLTAIGSISFLGRFSERRRSWFSLLLGLYAFFTIASTAFSQRPWLALAGAPGRCEGALVLVSYAIIAFLAMNEAGRSGFSRKLLAAAVAGSLVISLIGVAQFLNHDPFRTEAGKLLIVPKAEEAQVKLIQFMIANGFVYGTLPNPNYTGSYTAILVTVTFGLVWFTRGWTRWALMIPHLLMYVSWMGCRSRAGVLGGAVAIALLLFIGRRRWRENLKLIGVLVLSYGLLSFWMDYMSLKTPSSHRLFENFSSRRMSHAMPAAGDYKDLVLATDSFDLVYTGNTMHCEYKDGNIEFRNQAGNIVPYEWNGQQLKFPKGEFLGFHVSVATEAKVFQLTRLETTINLIHTKQGFMYLTERLRPMRFRKIERLGFEGHEQWGSMRGYVWSRSLPLLWDAVGLGFGPDMFFLHFPQDDYLEKLKTGIPLTLMFDKPHNLFLQIGINTGGLSLLTLLVLFGGYLVQSLRLFWRARFEDDLETDAACIAATVAGYLAAGMFNDSSVSVAPVFWALLGTGIGLNLILADRPAPQPDTPTA